MTSKAFVIDPDGNYYFRYDLLLEILKNNKKLLEKDGFTQAINYNDAIIKTFRGVLKEEKRAKMEE